MTPDLDSPPASEASRFAAIAQAAAAKGRAHCASNRLASALIVASIVAEL